MAPRGRLGYNHKESTRHQKKMNALSVLLALCCTCLTAVRPTCVRTAPDTCTFEQGNDCKWVMTDHWTIYHNYPSTRRSLGLTGHHRNVERLESQTACATNQAVHCLKLSYLFEEDYVLKLSVYLRTPQRGKEKVWEVSSSRGWESGQVPVSSDTEFKVVIEAWASRSRRVFIDVINYERRACDIKPGDAVPPLPVITEPPTQQTTTQPLPDTTSTAGRTNSTTPAPPDSSREERLIIGAIAAVVGVVVVGVVLCVLCRRKRVHEVKTCCKRQQRKEEGFPVEEAWHNALHAQDGNEAERFLNLEMNLERSAGGLQGQGDHDASPTPSSPHHYYSTIESPVGNGKFTFAAAERAQAKLPHKRNNRRLDPTSEGNPYKITDCSEVFAMYQTAPDDNYNNLNFCKADGGDHPVHNVLLSSAEQTCDYKYPTSNEAKTPSASAGRDDGARHIPNTGDRQRATALYQNVHSFADLQEHQRRLGPADVLQDAPDRVRGDQTTGVDHLSKETIASRPDRLPKPRDVRELSPLKSPVPIITVSHAPKEGSPSELCPESSQTSRNGRKEQYQHLDFGGKGLDEENGEHVPFMMYSHLNDGAEGYNEIDRDRRIEVIDGDYHHI